MTEKLKRFDSSRPARAAVLILLWAVLFALNRWTPYLADDFRYMFGFDTKKLLSSVSGLIPSMEAHARMMNGRVIAHGLEQLFLLMPKTVFNLLNAGAFLLTLWQACRFCLPEGKRSALLPLVFFAGIWLVLPVFGQVCLWQVGALNYLWSVGLALVFLRPFLREYEGGETRLWRRLLFLPFAFVVGMYTEVASLIALLMGLALTLLGALRRRSLRSWLWLPLLCGAAGFWLLLQMPAEVRNKMGGMELPRMLERLGPMAESFLRHFAVPAALWVLLTVLALRSRRTGGCSALRLTESLVFFLGGVAASFELIAAADAPERCLSMSAFLLLIACGILLCELMPRTRLRPLLICAALVLWVFCGLSFAGGARDVRSTWYQWTAREKSIYEQKAAGYRWVYVTEIKAETPYSPVWQIRDLHKKDTTWPNIHMARLYGVKRVVWIENPKAWADMDPNPDPWTEYNETPASRQRRADTRRRPERG